MVPQDDCLQVRRRLFQLRRFVVYRKRKGRLVVSVPVIVHRVGHDRHDDVPLKARVGLDGESKDGIRIDSFDQSGPVFSAPVIRMSPLVNPVDGTENSNLRTNVESGLPSLRQAAQRIVSIATVGFTRLSSPTTPLPPRPHHPKPPRPGPRSREGRPDTPQPDSPQ